MLVMKGLTLQPPWAWLVPDPKAIETRSWRTHYRGWVAIHVSKKWNKESRTFAEHPAVQTEIARLCGVPIKGLAWADLPMGAIVAVVRIAGCIRTEGFRVPTRESAWGDYSPKRFAWILEDGYRLTTPIVCPGKLGLWTVPDDIVAQIRADVRLNRKDAATCPTTK